LVWNKIQMTAVPGISRYQDQLSTHKMNEVILETKLLN